MLVLSQGIHKFAQCYGQNKYLCLVGSIPGGKYFFQKQFRKKIDGIRHYRRGFNGGGNSKCFVTASRRETFQIHLQQEVGQLVVQCLLQRKNFDTRGKRSMMSLNDYRYRLIICKLFLCGSDSTRLAEVLIKSLCANFAGRRRVCVC